MKFSRSAGILLHPTSLPSKYGIGDLGSSAFVWLDFLASSGCGLWQVLPLGPTGYGDSPYQCLSSFAGNPLMISPQLLFEDGLLERKDLQDIPYISQDVVKYGKVIPWKLLLLNKAFNYYEKKHPPQIIQDFISFQKDQSFWLPDYSLFITLKEKHHGASWIEWNRELKNRESQAISNAQQQYAKDIMRHSFHQYLFFRQWKNLHQKASILGIKIIGDLPIFASSDSCDVWSNPDLFFLGKDGRPSVVAGVPPDYFSKTGQLWGNPLYRWDKHAAENYAWWTERFRTALELADILRLDHFRGFSGYWEVPGDAITAEHGRWVTGPGKSLFLNLEQKLGKLPVIAEDLGEITADVIELRDFFGYPGMKILQFGFDGDPDNPFLPHNYAQNCVAYTGTHDNDTTLGWYNGVSSSTKNFCQQYLGMNRNDVTWDIIRACWASVAIFAIAPLQDFLNLDNQARMNYPGNPVGNWTWRVNENALTETLRDRIREINFLYSRLNESAG